MGESEFVPFVARRIEPAGRHAACEVSAPDASETVPSDDSTVAELSTASTEEAHDLPAPAARDEEFDKSADRVEAEADRRTPEDSVQDDRVPRELHEESAKCCDHSVEIRNEAVRLAAIACGRALRHAVVLHPRTIVAFVDDALRSCGYPQSAAIHLNPDLIAAAPSLPGAIGDANLGPGDVWIEFDESSVGADVATRAQVLVAAAAER